MLLRLTSDLVDRLHGICGWRLFDTFCLHEMTALAIAFLFWWSCNFPVYSVGGLCRMHGPHEDRWRALLASIRTFLRARRWGEMNAGLWEQK